MSLVGSVRVNGIHEAAASSGYATCPPNLVTECCLWTDLVRFAETMRVRVEGVLPACVDRSRIISVLVNGFLNHLANRLDLVSRQTILFEKAVYEKSLGPDIQLSMAQFSELFREDASRIFELYATYPELERIVALHTENILAFSEEFLVRFISDVDALAGLTATGLTLSDLQGIEISGGETHCGHRSVVTVIAHDQPLIGYKPRCLKLESKVTGLLVDLSNSTKDAMVRGWALPKYLCRDGYGWVSWLPTKPVWTKSESETYYRRAGYLIAFLTVVTGSDMHSGNIVAHGSSPVPVDLEACFVHLRRKDTNEVELLDEFQFNCLSTGLLPSWIWKGADMVGVDLSGLGGLQSQYCSTPIYQNLDKDEVNESYGQSGVKFDPDNNVVWLDGKIQNPYDYLDSIKRGFRQAASDIQSEMERFKSLIASTRLLPGRFIARPTVGYHYAVQCSFNPRLMGSAEDRRKFIRECLNNDTTVDETLFAAEIAACVDCEIPRVVTQPACLDIEDAYYGGKTSLSPAEYIRGDESAATLLSSFRGGRIDFEEMLIVGTITSIANNFDELSKPGRITVEETQEYSSIDVEDALRHVRKYLLDFVMGPGSDRLEWYGYKISPNNTPEFGFLGDDQYCGMTGILYALLQLKNSPEFVKGEVTALVDRYSSRLIKQNSRQSPRLGGAYVGAASTFVPMCILLRELVPTKVPEFLESAKKCSLEALKSKSPGAYFWGLDLFTGVTGFIAVCGLLARMEADDDWLKIGDIAWKYLKSKSTLFEGQSFLPHDASISSHPSLGLTGLSHGAIGMAVALNEFMKAGSAPSKAEMTTVRDDLTRWELLQFNRKAMNWPDYRMRSAVGQAGEVTWSHGCPGIYLALHELAASGSSLSLDFLEKNDYRHAVEHFVMRKQYPLSENLCQGALGIVLSSRRVLGESYAEYSQLIERWSRLGYYVELDRRPARLRVVDAPGLWIGKSGTLLALSALIYEDKTIPVPLLPGDFLQFKHSNLY